MMMTSTTTMRSRKRMHSKRTHQHRKMVRMNTLVVLWTLMIVGMLALDDEEQEDAFQEDSSESEDGEDEYPGRVMDTDDCRNAGSCHSQRIVARECVKNLTTNTTANSLAGGSIGGGAEQLVQTAMGVTLSSPSYFNPNEYVRGMSKSDSIRKRRKHVALRVRAYVKSTMFRKIKFINSDAMFQKAMNLVMDNQAVPYHLRGKFQMLYESVFNEALNTKRSSSEQAGGKGVRETIDYFKQKGEFEDSFFTMEELCKVRRSTTDREQSAFLWFYGTFLECICGKRTWGKAKQHQLLSEAVEENGSGKLVTKSDEAFALLVFENYIDKWLELAKSDNDGKRQAWRKTNNEESTQERKVAIANMEVGVVKEQHGSMNCITWFKRKEQVRNLMQWKRNNLHSFGRTRVRDKKWVRRMNTMLMQRQ